MLTLIHIETRVRGVHLSAAESKKRKREMEEEDRRKAKLAKKNKVSILRKIADDDSSDDEDDEEDKVDEKEREHVKEMRRKREGLKQACSPASGQPVDLEKVKELMKGLYRVMRHTIKRHRIHMHTFI